MLGSSMAGTLGVGWLVCSAEEKERKKQLGVLCEKTKVNGSSSLPAIGIDGEERLLLHLGEFKELVLVGDFELFEDDGDLPWIGASAMVVKDDWLHDCGLVD